MPCQKSLREASSAKSRPQIEITCVLKSFDESEVLVTATAQDLLKELESMGPVGGEEHANHFEMEAQRALLRHSLQYRVSFRLNDDHWHRTHFALLNLFDVGKATMLVSGVSLRVTELTKEEWRVGTEALASHGGSLYRTLNGEVVFKWGTWRS